jgi:hypothetical protein
MHQSTSVPANGPTAAVIRGAISLGRGLLYCYLYVGVVFFFLSEVSASIYYLVGPGAIWNIGLIESLSGWFFASFYSVARILIWPYGLYLVITTDMTFLQWLFYVWHQSVPAIVR